jgi:hypothetical protein
MPLKYTRVPSPHGRSNASARYGALPASTCPPPNPPPAFLPLCSLCLCGESVVFSSSGFRHSDFGFDCRYAALCLRGEIYRQFSDFDFRISCSLSLILPSEVGFGSKYASSQPAGIGVRRANELQGIRGEFDAERGGLRFQVLSSWLFFLSCAPPALCCKGLGRPRTRPDRRHPSFHNSSTPLRPLHHPGSHEPLTMSHSK